jgi:hypothetical protein
MGRRQIAGHFSLSSKSNIHGRRRLWRSRTDHLREDPMPTDVTSTLIFLVRLLTDLTNA